MILTRRGFLLGAGAVAVAAQALPLANAIAWAEQELPKEIEVVRLLGRIVRVAGSGVMGDGLIVAAPGKQVESWLLTTGHYGFTVYPRTPISRALEALREAKSDTAYIPDFRRRAAEIRALAAEDPQLAAVLEYARDSSRRIILPSERQATRLRNGSES